MNISVITAVYNRVGTIAHSVNSVLTQSHHDIELLVQDGGSTDGTLAVLASITDPRLDLVTESDFGIYDAINRGIARAEGDIIGVMHSDDFFAHDLVLENVAKVFSNPEIDGVYGDLDYVSAADPERVIRAWRAGEYSHGQLSRGWMPPHPTLYLRREVIEQWGGYDTRFRIAADYDAMLRWIAKGKIRLAYLPEVMVRMRVGGESNRSLGRIIRKSREDYRALQQNDVGGIYALTLKNLSKISQFWKRGKKQI